MNRQSWKSKSIRLAAASGFSLLELMVAMAMFMVIGAAAMTLIKAHMPIASTTANQSGLTMNLRNALAQVELDAVNAGTGFYPGANLGDWPIGFTIINAPQGAACNDPATYTFGPNCFDTLNIISGDPSVAPMHPAGLVDTNSGTASITATTNAPALAAALPPGTTLLWLKPGQPPQLTATTVTSATANGGTVTVNFDQTTGNGVNDPANDPYQIASYQDATYLNTATILTNQFDANSWILKVNPVTYKVDLTDLKNPKLVRVQGGTTDVVAEQIIGFRVGASLRYVGSGTDSLYSFDSSPTGYKYDWAQVRAIRVSVIGRTPPSSDLATNYHNKFDGGPYKIQGLSVTINPRNLSMTDQF